MNVRQLLGRFIFLMGAACACVLGAGSIDGPAWAQFPGGLHDTLGRLYAHAAPDARPLSIRPQPGLDPVRRWHTIAINASGLDHTPVAAGENRVFGEQLGPGRATRAMAIVHVAIFEAVNAIAGGPFVSYARIEPAAASASMPAAVAQAAHDTLIALFPSQAASLDELLAEDLRTIADGEPAQPQARANGVELGRRVAGAILALRAEDGARHKEPRIAEFPAGDAPGWWRQDPIGRGPLALGAYWGQITPFVIPSAAEFRVPPPPALTSLRYEAAFAEVQRLGGDGVVTPTVRTEDQTMAGLYWAYDGTPSLCAPSRLYNQIAVLIADQQGSTLVDVARLLALVNLGSADAAIAAWESKYFYRFWRPVTGIREADAGTGPTGQGDGNALTRGDPAFTPLGSPASNLNGPNFTPPFPAYPGGHATLGGTLFQTLRRFYGTDAIAFTFVSDELNGVTRDRDGHVRPLLPRRFESLSAAEDENARSRVYLGVHWEFDNTEGIVQGRRVADYVFDRALRPRIADLTADAELTMTAFRRVPRTRTFAGRVTVRNPSSRTFAGPLHVAFDQLTPGATLAGAAATMEGAPCMMLQVSPLAPGAAVSVMVLIHVPDGAAVRFAPRLLSGPLP